MRNEAHFQLFTEFKELAEKITPAELGIAPLYNSFLSSYNEEDTALELISKSPETAKLNEADHKRGITFRALSNYVEANLLHFNEEKRAAAEKLKIVFSHFGNIARRADSEETAAIYNLLQELKTVYPPQITLLNLNEWVDELEKKNNEYNAIFLQRNESVAARTSLRPAETRKKLQTVYKQISERLEAAALLNGASHSTAKFISEWNNIIKYFGKKSL